MNDLSLIEVIGVACFSTFIVFALIAMIDISIKQLMKRLDIQPSDIVMTLYFGLAIYGVYVLYVHWEQQIGLFSKLVK